MVKFDGFLAVYQEGRDEDPDDEDARRLPEMSAGEPLSTRVAHEVPDEPVTEDPLELELVDPADEDVEGFDDEEELFARGVDTGDNVQTFTGPNGASYRVSQSLDNMLGKQLRIDVAKFNSGAATRNDTVVGHLIPANNPFVGTATGRPPPLGRTPPHPIDAFQNRNLTPNGAAKNGCIKTTT